METLLVVLILGILSVVLIRAYITISQVWLRIQQESQVTQEVLTLSQIIWNFSERNTIDYEKYAENYWTWYLSDHQWIVEILYLSWQDGKLSFYTTWFWCLLDPGVEFNLTGDIKQYTQNCRLELEQNWNVIKLINEKKVYLSKSVFKVVPFASQNQFIQDQQMFQKNLCKFDQQDSNYLACLHKPWFRIIMKAYSSSYNQNRSNNVSFNIQQFFNTSL